MAKHSILLTKRVFLLYSVEAQHPIGTCFGLAKPGLLLTATHVLDGTTTNQLRVVTMAGNVDVRPIDKVEHHPHADVSAVFVASNDTDEYFIVGSPGPEATDFPLGEEVISYGYPLMANERPINPGLMKAHIQSRYPYTSEPYRYTAYELAFPAFPGVSGSPVIRDWERQEAIGLVTEGMHYSSELGDDKRKPRGRSPSRYRRWKLG